MNMINFTQKQGQQILERGIFLSVVQEQINNFRKGFPFLKIIDSATPNNNGIKILDVDQQTQACKAKEEFKSKIVKFVPASGAASRMFKDLFQAYDELEKGWDLTLPEIKRFFDRLRDFPFMNEKEILNLILYSNGLNYSNTPKGLVAFHKYINNLDKGAEEIRTAFEEHLIEGAKYAKDKNGNVNIIFTVSPEHMDAFKSKFEEVKEKYEKRYECKLNVKFTIQSPATDTIAADMNNTPFVTSKGDLLFRPGGHGALLQNLNEVADADIIIIKNIDNVVREELLPSTILWKNVLVGRALELTRQAHKLLREMSEIDEGSIEEEKFLDKVSGFLKKEFCLSEPVNYKGNRREKLFAKLNRPIRVCGMVKNEGEPGGGPYIVEDSDGYTSLQILESAQINKSDLESVAKMKHSTHFNPVDLVCSIKDYKGDKFNLMQFSDPSTGFISEKSYEGRPLKAQELPGLWNGAMSSWNTQFIEVPLATFNPVKTVMDLLRKEHCGS